MREYHIYCIDGKNHVVSRHNFDAPDDLAAFDKAAALCGAYEVEVWERNRLVARLAKDGTASQRSLVGPDAAA